ncbi:MAG: YraN family protein [Bacteroidota bacterium]|jgi:putative endonuclease
MNQTFQSHNLGKQGEEIAARWLLKQGYTILEKRWRWKHLEIDIVAQKNELLVIVEVKSRTNAQHADPDDTISNQKLRCLYDITEHYMEVKKVQLEVRYDLITIIDHGETYTIEHIEEAFYPFMG